MSIASPHCLAWERQTAWRAFSRAWAKTGKRIAARMAMMAITTRSSISVNAVCSSRIMTGFTPLAAGLVVDCLLRAGPGGVAVEEDIVAAAVVAQITVLLCRLQHIVLVE